MSGESVCGYEWRVEISWEDRYARADGWDSMENPKESASTGLTLKLLVSNIMSMWIRQVHQHYILRGRIGMALAIRMQMHQFKFLSNSI
jgi:hypothetical protein